jgi:hypothetical protein
MFAKQINSLERLLGIVAQGQFVPIHFIPNIPVLHPFGASYRCSNCSWQYSQEKSAVAA